MMPALETRGLYGVWPVGAGCCAGGVDEQGRSTDGPSHQARAGRRLRFDLHRERGLGRGATRALLGLGALIGARIRSVAPPDQGPIAPQGCAGPCRPVAGVTRRCGADLGRGAPRGPSSGRRAPDRGAAERRRRVLSTDPGPRSPRAATRTFVARSRTRRASRHHSHGGINP